MHAKDIIRIFHRTNIQISASCAGIQIWRNILTRLLVHKTQSKYRNHHETQFINHWPLSLIKHAHLALHTPERMISNAKSVDTARQQLHSILGLIHPLSQVDLDPKQQKGKSIEGNIYQKYIRPHNMDGYLRYLLPICGSLFSLHNTFVHLWTPFVYRIFLVFFVYLGIKMYGNLTFLFWMLFKLKSSKVKNKYELKL